jgi:hypothetical protein
MADFDFEAKIEEYGRGPETLDKAFSEMPREAWSFKPAPDEWSVHEIMVHMADSEGNGVARLYKLIAEPGSQLMPYDEAAWAKALGYENQNAEDALQIFRLLRRRTHEILKAMPEATRANSVVHPEWDRPYTVKDWLEIYVNHVPEHLEQAQRVIEAWKKQGKSSK